MTCWLCLQSEQNDFASLPAQGGSGVAEHVQDAAEALHHQVDQGMAGTHSHHLHKVSPNLLICPCCCNDIIAVDGRHRQLAPASVIVSQYACGSLSTPITCLMAQAWPMQTLGGRHACWTHGPGPSLLYSATCQHKHLADRSAVKAYSIYVFCNVQNALVTCRSHIVVFHHHPW